MQWRKLGEVEKSAPYYRLGHVYAKNYQSWLKFDKVMMQTILPVFWGTVYRRNLQTSRGPG